MISIITIGEDGLPRSRLGEEGRVWDINFRKDRQKQWVDAVTNPAFDEFIVSEEAKRINVFGMVQYVPAMSIEMAFLEDIRLSNGLVEVLYKNGIKIIYVFDAEKGKFIPAFRGGREEPFSKEQEDLEFGSISMPVLMTAEEKEQFNPDLSSETW